MSTVPRVPSAIEGADASFMTALAHQPGLASAFFALYGTMWSHGLVDQVTLETIRLRNARVTDCGFCRQVRFDRARLDGLTEDVADLIADGYEASLLADRQKLALRFADAYLANRSPEPTVSRALLAEWSSAEIVEMALAASLFLGLAKALIAMGAEPVPGTMPTTVLPTPDHLPMGAP